MRPFPLLLWFGVLCSACGFDVASAPDGGAPMEVTVGFRSPTSLEDEASGTTMVPVSLSAAAAEPVSIRYDVIGGTATLGVDFEATGGMLTFAAGDTEAAIPITILPDGEEEQAETIDLELSSPINARLGASRHTVTIAADILPRIRFQAPATSIEDEDVSPVLVLTLDAEALPDTTVDYVVEGTATLGADHTLADGTLQVQAGVKITTLTVPVLDDALDEFEETVMVRLTSSSNVVIDSTIPSHTHTIKNNDPPPSVALTEATHTATEGSANSYVMTFQLSGPSGKPVSVSYQVNQSGSTAAQGEDFVFAPATQLVTFAPGETTKTVVISFPDDDVHEGTELAVIELASPTNATLGTITRLDLTIEDNEPVPTVAWGSPGDRQEDERDYTSRDYTYNLVLSGRSSKPVILGLTVSGTAEANDYSFPDGTQIEFAPGELTKPLILRVIADRRDEDNETVIMTITSATNAQIGTPHIRTHTIIDDDD